MGWKSNKLIDNKIWRWNVQGHLIPHCFMAGKTFQDKRLLRSLERT